MSIRTSLVALCAVTAAHAGCKSNQRSDPETCGASFCGCWEDKTLKLAATVVDPNGTPLEGVTVTCLGETAPVATSDASGKASFSIKTKYSPGCKYKRCSGLRFEHPKGGFDTLQQTVIQANGKNVTLTPK